MHWRHLGMSLPKSRFERTDDVGRQGTDAQQRVRNARSGLCRARCRFRKLRPLDLRSAANLETGPGSDWRRPPGRQRAREKSRTIELVLPGASMPIWSSSFSFLASCNKPLRSRSTFPASRSFPFSKMAVWANDRWTSRAMYSSFPAPSRFQQRMGAGGLTRQLRIPRSQRNRASRRGRPDNNSSSQLDFGQFSSAARDAEHRITLNDLVSALEHELHAADVPECRPPPFDA